MFPEAAHIKVPILCVGHVIKVPIPDKHQRRYTFLKKAAYLYYGHAFIGQDHQFYLNLVKGYQQSRQSSEEKLLSLLGRVYYNWNDNYLVNFRTT